MTVYSVLESNVNLTVKFRMNPVSNYAIHWWMGGSELPNTNVGYAVKKEYVETTYFISNMTQEQLGNYTVHVINWAITGEHNKVTFNVILKLPGKKSKAVFLSPYSQMLPTCHVYEFLLTIKVQEAGTFLM